MFNDIVYVSVHGGHSGEFCHHAEDRLEAMVNAYIEKGFTWVGLTEHMPPPEDRFLYPDEVEAGYTAAQRYAQFEAYIHECRRLKSKYLGEIDLLVGFESETYEGSEKQIRRLLTTFHPDYFVGSVHHIGGRCFDFSKAHYALCVKAAGNIDALYAAYFDRQFEMIESLKPPVVGHFDLIRIYDPHYRERLMKTSMHAKILRNLQCIKAHGLILELNVRALFKGASEPYGAESILREAQNLGIPVVPGDDSHSVATVGAFIREGIDLLKKMGFDLNWVQPLHLLQHKGSIDERTKASQAS